MPAADVPMSHNSIPGSVGGHVASILAAHTAFRKNRQTMTFKKVCTLCLYSQIFLCKEASVSGLTSFCERRKSLAKIWWFPVP